jgi:hypothetical protein
MKSSTAIKLNEERAINPLEHTSESGSITQKSASLSLQAAAEQKNVGIVNRA